MFARSGFCGLVALAFITLVHGSAQAQRPGEVVTVVDPIDIPPENDPLAHAWDTPGDRAGLYLRLSTSIGVQNTRVGPAGWESDIAGQTVNGFASGYNVHFGGLLRPWLALHLDASIGVLWNGDVEELRVLGETRDGNARVAAYGLAPALTFFTRNNFYFTPAFGVGFATMRWPGVEERTNPGFYMNLIAGKDVYTDDHFAVGLQFQIAYMMLGHDDESLEARVRQFLFGVSFGFDSR
jgi:hypothetical protein